MKSKLMKRILPVVLLIVCAMNADAQKKGVIGFRLMPTISSMKLKSSTGGSVKSEAVLGFGIGGLLGYNFSEYVGLQAEVIYNSISQKYKEPNTTHRVDLKYINVPLLVSFSTGRYNKVNANFVVGPQMGISLGSSVSTSGSDTAQAVLAVRRSDLGFAYGAGLDFALNEKKTARLAVGFRGVYGLFDVSNNKTTTNQNSYYILDKTNVQTYSLYVGINLLF